MPLRLNLFHPEIINLHNRGWSYREIAHALRGEALRDKKPPNWTDPTEAEVYHFIQSLGMVSPFSTEPRPTPWGKI